jgi:hypothetical protein
MAKLSPRARHRKDEPDSHEQNARHVLELVEAWGLPHEQRARSDVDELWFDSLERAEVRTVADVWARRR